MNVNNDDGYHPSRLTLEHPAQVLNVIVQAWPHDPKTFTVREFVYVMYILWHGINTCIHIYSVDKTQWNMNMLGTCWNIEWRTCANIVAYIITSGMFNKSKIVKSMAHLFCRTGANTPKYDHFKHSLQLQNYIVHMISDLLWHGMIDIQYNINIMEGLYIGGKMNTLETDTVQGQKSVEKDH